MEGLFNLPLVRTRRRLQYTLRLVGIKPITIIKPIVKCLSVHVSYNSMEFFKSQELLSVALLLC